MRHLLRFALFSLVVTFGATACGGDSPTSSELARIDLRLSIEGSCPADFTLVEGSGKTDRNGDGYICRKTKKVCPGNDGSTACKLVRIRLDNSKPKSGSCSEGYDEVPASREPDADVNGDGIICELDTGDEVSFTDNDQ